MRANRKETQQRSFISKYFTLSIESDKIEGFTAFLSSYIVSNLSKQLLVIYVTVSQY